MDVKEIGNRIRSVREEKGLSLDDIAMQIGVTRSTVQRYECGKIEKPKLPVLEAIARALQVNPAWLVGKSDDKMGGVRYQTLDIFTSEPAKEALYGMLTKALNESFSGDEFVLIGKYRQLNDEGKSKLSAYLSDLLDMPKYKNTPQPPNDD